MRKLNRENNLLMHHIFGEDKPHPEFGNLYFGKNIWEEIKINQKWSFEKDFLHVHALFLQVS